MVNNIIIGKYGEDLAEKFLKDKGYMVLERNYKKPWGEIDIVCCHGKKIIFVEVKTQNKNNKFFIRPEENITIFKRRQIIKASMAYLSRKKWLDRDWQIDVVAVELDRDGYFDIRHIENAITADFS